MTNAHQNLLDLKARVDSGTVCGFKGICRHLDRWPYEKDLPRGIFQNWLEYSGHPAYPVPSPESEVSPEDAYWKAFEKDAMWVGEYGAARIRLLNWLIERTAP